MGEKEDSQKYDCLRFEMLNLLLRNTIKLYLLFIVKHKEEH